MPNYGDPLSSLVEPTFGSCDFNVQDQCQQRRKRDPHARRLLQGHHAQRQCGVQPGLYVLNGDGLDIQSSADRDQQRECLRRRHLLPDRQRHQVRVREASPPGLRSR